MANPQNIIGKEFKKGQSGNPAGRPKGIPNAKTRYQRILNMIEKVKNPVTGELEDFTVAEIMDMKLIQKARSGDISAYKEVMDRLEGRAAQAIDLTSGGESISKVRDLSDNEINERLQLIARVANRKPDSSDGTGSSPSKE